MTSRVLLTGATGYIGGLLLRRFEAHHVRVRALARDPARLGPLAPTTEAVRGDCLDAASLDAALVGIEVAYYLVHSMAGAGDYAATDRHAAETFGRAAARAGVRRIVYLGGLTGSGGATSTHLRSRAETGEVLRASGVPVVEFRSSIVVGAGSLSFQMIEALVERLPVMICPRWVSTLTQPIAVADVIAYLAAALDAPDDVRGVTEIGGPQVLSYGEMMKEYARLRGLRRWMIEVPVLTPHLSGLWLALVTPAQARVGRALVEGLRSETVVTSSANAERFAVPATPLREAFARAIEERAAVRLKQDTRHVEVDATPAEAFSPIRRIGGAAGWYFGNLAWSARGALDRCVGGVGMSRGRRDAEACDVGDVIDGWRVERYEPDRLLRLAADLKMPGRGWLEFEVTPLGGGRSRIRQTATFDPRGVLGRAYWYGILPVHDVMFGGMLAAIARRANRPSRP